MADNEFVTIDEEGGGSSTGTGEGTGTDSGVVTFGDDEGSDFEAAPDPDLATQVADFGGDGDVIVAGGTPEDRAQEVVDSFDPTKPLPDGPLGGGSLGTLEDGPSIVGPSREGPDVEALREALTEEMLSNEERERLGEELRDAILRNNQDNIDRRVDPDGEGTNVFEPVVGD